ncbi:methyl-CpG-binding domain protein 4-like isoform X1 [Tripterygium wilfordii]|nr:methyl-CpG-binding domain protein 4-like isoform X1 [Tripterygium wilfordii]XP_038722498.1 methyl-CpG-binding domain protein 4-like isoform X1 [Tripterygium wilfordii]XP_038722499.1 methyl-CpG-binding domain protein 4-like isoform X1 [Tripterygium wilfordii]XP_038722500.1 methyl-CpG-binding domain protein 4-like isoform X1 [Tripterygium wilfordii]
MQQGGNEAIVEEQNFDSIRGPVGLETLILNGNEEMPGPQLLQDQMSSFQESLQIVDLQRGDEASSQQDRELINGPVRPQLSDVIEGTSEPQLRRNRRGRRPETNQRPPWLPEGWRIMTKTRQNGSSAGHVDKYYVRPDGKKFRSKKEVEDYLRRTTADANQANSEMEYTTLSG